MRKITHIVIHCSATKPGADIGVREIGLWHRQRGFNGCGYHYVIRRDGRLETGRPLEKIGAHVAGHNSNSVGVCLAGGVDEAGKAENNFAPPQWEALTGLLRRLRKQFPKAEILGHRDFPGVAKDCPCFDARAWAAGLSEENIL